MDLPQELIKRLQAMDSTGKAQFPHTIDSIVKSTFIEYV